MMGRCVGRFSKWAIRIRVFELVGAACRHARVTRWCVLRQLPRSKGHGPPGGGFEVVAANVNAPQRAHRAWETFRRGMIESILALPPRMQRTPITEPRLAALCA
jgi:hypothetical protein